MIMAVLKLQVSILAVSHWRTFFNSFIGEADPAKVSIPSHEPMQTIPVASESGDAGSAEVEQTSSKLEEGPPLR